VASVGPVSVFMRVEESFYNYESGVYYEPTCGKEVNHIMLLVGYGTDPKLGDYWLIKNSWGKSSLMCRRIEEENFLTSQENLGVKRDTCALLGTRTIIATLHDLQR
jgi:Papain family cysteine protease